MKPNIDNPFHYNYIFTQTDKLRLRAKFSDKLRFLFYPTYVFCNEGYAWFYKRNRHGEILLVKIEELRGGR